MVRISHTFRIKEPEVFARFKTFCNEAGIPLSHALSESMKLFLDKRVKKQPRTEYQEMNDRFVARQPGFTPLPIRRVIEKNREIK